jgi:hypothetical protein
MKRARQRIVNTPAHVVSRHWVFFCAMLGFLMLPFTPVQFTSMLTAVVWIFSGMQYAVVFTVLGTFRLDSFPIFNGIQDMVQIFAPSVTPFSSTITVLVMFFGNFATAYLFKRLFVGKLVSRLRPP